MQAARTLIVIEITRGTLETMLTTIIQTVSFSLMSLTVLATTVVVWNGLPI
jgi:hypothetical protein